MPEGISSIVLLTMVSTFAGPSATTAQISVTTIDSRTPLEMNAGTDLDQDLMLIGALFSNPDGISVFTGPADGAGPFSEEIAIATGDPFFFTLSAT